MNRTGAKFATSLDAHQERALHERTVSTAMVVRSICHNIEVSKRSESVVGAAF
jgi:hypothetical protein